METATGPREFHRGRFTRIVTIDEKGPGGAHHFYRVWPADEQDTRGFAEIAFQKGGVVEAGINGCHNEDLLMIVRDRLECFQAGPFPCRENQQALDAVKAALSYLDSRTRDRQARGVEGVSVA